MVASTESGEVERDDAMCKNTNMCAGRDFKFVNGRVENCCFEEKQGGEGGDIREARHKSTRILAASKM